MTRSISSRIARLESLTASLAPVPPIISRERARGALAVKVCGAYCLTVAEQDELRAHVEADRIGQADALVTEGVRRLAAHFSDLTPPTAPPDAVRAWADRWVHRAREWAPGCHWTDAEHAA